jgi:hypothetical protein
MQINYKHLKSNVMKMLKLVLIAMILVFSVAGAANAEGFKSKPVASTASKVVKLSLAKALQIPGLVTAIKQQINPQEILNSNGKSYTALVIYQNVTYLITGTHQEWILFMVYYNLIDDGTSS